MTTHPQSPLLALSAPANSLPTWDECKLRVDNSDFIAKRVAEGGYGPEGDEKLAAELHRFIYEYDDADPFRSAWFLHRLELLLNETKAEAESYWKEMHRAANARGEWLPIESAPKNKRVLVWDGYHVSISMFGKVSHVPIYGWLNLYADVENIEIMERQPTHWKELTPPTPGSEVQP